MFGAVLVLVLAGCADPSDGDGSAPDPIDGTRALRVGAFDFPESALLAELYAQSLEANGIAVRRVGAAAPREVLGPAVEQGQVDLLPEYLGTAASFFGLDRVETGHPSVEDLRNVLEFRGLTALEPAPAENVNVFVALAESGLGPSLSALADDAPNLRFGGTAECPHRPLCLAGLERTYGLEFAAFVPQSSLPITAEALRRDEIDIGLMFSTDAALTPEFMVLDDDQGLQPSENVVPVIRLDALERWGESAVRDALDAVSRALDTESLRALNRRVAGGEPTEVVAEDWLTSVGIGEVD
ncbi:MAG: glycine/betaine ABC transporter substrate-binding protein [Acidimicrobiales bacterium]|nr:MAG: glycine/betaine ABC transporter substrate-binding protein [Acidimicrobiales bacterium]